LSSNTLDDAIAVKICKMYGGSEYHLRTARNDLARGYRQSRLVEWQERYPPGKVLFAEKQQTYHQSVIDSCGSVAVGYSATARRSRLKPKRRRRDIGRRRSVSNETNNLYFGGNVQ
jgi:hypothetical protein